MRQKEKFLAFCIADNPTKICNSGVLCWRRRQHHRMRPLQIAFCSIVLLALAVVHEASLSPAVPEVIAVSKRIGQMVGKATILECEVRPLDMQLEWRFNETQILQREGKFRIDIYQDDDYDQTTFSLMIVDLTPEDFGMYICLAKNELGSSQDTVTLYELKNSRRTGEYGSSCDLLSLCQEGLECIEGKCQCPTAFFYHSAQRSCKKVCKGTDWGFKEQEIDSLPFYQRRYTNCSYVDGNLELIKLDTDSDLFFLQDIEEISGYLLVWKVHTTNLPLNSLNLIRGTSLILYNDKAYSMLVVKNSDKRGENGLVSINLPRLREIQNGDVYFRNNNDLCYVNTIKWDDITESGSKVVFYNNFRNRRSTCQQCATSCYNSNTGLSHCWGPNPDQCQDLHNTLEECTCEKRCYGGLPNQCCHPECTAGCTGPTAKHCLACKHVDDGGECLASCPVDGRFLLAGRFCVPKCPDGYITVDGTCEAMDVDGQGSSKTNSDCSSEPADVRCPGVADSGYLHAGNIDSFRGCTVVEGNLKLVRMSFTGDVHSAISPLGRKDLYALKDIREVTGCISIQETPPDITSLDFLSNLRSIHGLHLTSGHALTIVKTNMEYLGLSSLRHVNNGNILIALNDKLCYMKDLTTEVLFGSSHQKQRVVSNKDFRVCSSEGKVCSTECTKGCWGPGKQLCLCTDTEQCHSDVKNVTCPVSKEEDKTEREEGQSVAPSENSFTADRNETCHKKTRTEIVHDEAGLCRSVQAADVDYCVGLCESWTSVLMTESESWNTKPTAQKFRCCSATLSGRVTILEAVCGEQNVTKRMHLPMIDSCQCTPCNV